MKTRVPKLESHVHRGVQAERGAVYIGRLPAECDDLRQLPEIA